MNKSHTSSGKKIAHRIVSNFAWSVLSEAIGKGIFFLANIYLARILKVDNYGLFSLAQTVVLYFWLAVDLGTNMYSIREIAKNKENAEAIINPILTLRAVAGLAVFSIYILSIYIVGVDDNNKLAFIGCGLYLLTYSFYSDWALKGLEQFKYIAYGSLVSSIIFILGIYFIVNDITDAGVASFIWSISYFFGSASLLYFIYKKLKINLRPSFDLQVIFKHLRESIYFTFSGTMLALYQYFPILFLGVVYSTYEVGVFSAPYRIVMTVCHAGFIIAMSYYPVFAELNDNDNERFKHTQTKILWIVIAIGMVIAIPATIWGSLIISILLGGDFAGSVFIFQILIWLFPLYLIRHLIGTVLFASGLQGEFLKATSVGALFMITVGAKLIHTYGSLGASFSLLIAESVVIIVMILIQKKSKLVRKIAVKCDRTEPITPMPSEKVLRRSAPESDCADYDFINDPAKYFWCEIPPEAANRLLERIKTIGYSRAIAECLLEYPQLTKVLTDVSRADFLFQTLSESTPNSRCLDLGSGWGTISRLLSKHFQEVWSVESSRERIYLQKLARESLSIQNIRLIRGSITEPLPFEDGTFDFVVLNGVLEWTPCGAPHKSPKDVHAELLREIYRVLKPGGCLYLGIENRYAINYLLGAPDHSGLKFITLLPKFLADAYVRFSKKRFKNGRIDEWMDFRTVLYSWWGFRSLFKKSGFSNFKSYWVAPSYSYPKLSGPLEGRSFHNAIKNIEAIRFSENLSSKAKIAMRLVKTGFLGLLPLWAVRLFSPCFQFYAYKENYPANYEHEKFVSKGQFSYYRMSGIRGKIYYFNFQKGGSVTKIARNRDCNELLKKECSLEMIYGNLTPVVSEYAGLVTAEYPILKYRKIDTANIDEVCACLSWIENFQQKTNKAYWDSEELSAFLGTPLKELENSIFGHMISGETYLDLRRRIEIFVNKRLRKVSSHGDFAVGNIGYSLERVGLYVFDWEDYMEEADPLFDLAHFLLSISNERKIPLVELIAEEEAFGYRGLIERSLTSQGFGINDLLEYLPLMHLRLWLRSYEKMNITQAAANLRSFVKDGSLLNDSPAMNTCCVKMQVEKA